MVGLELNWNILFAGTLKVGLQTLLKLSPASVGLVSSQDVGEIPKLALVLHILELVLRLMTS